MLRGLSDAEIATLYWHWDFWARPDQLPPVGDWSAWMMLGGRGAGKTRAGAEWVRACIEAPPHQHRTYRTGRANAQNWRLAIQQINDRGEAGAPLFLPLPMNEAR